MNSTGFYLHMRFTENSGVGKWQELVVEMFGVFFALLRISPRQLHHSYDIVYLLHVCVFVIRSAV